MDHKPKTHHVTHQNTSNIHVSKHPNTLHHVPGISEKSFTCAGMFKSKNLDQDLKPKN